MTPLDRLLGAVRRLHQTTPALMRFAPWPDDLTALQVTPHPCPATQRLGSQPLPGTRATAPVIKALRRAAQDLDWKQSYSEDQVGRRFLETYGYVELFGPTGHFRSAKLRGYIGIWGPDLTYDWHDHKAEEMYFTLAGRAVFSARGAPNVVMRPGAVRVHSAHQPHLMLTLDQPYLAYAVWRGAGLEDRPRMFH